MNYVYERNVILCIFNEIFIFVKNTQYVVYENVRQRKLFQACLNIMEKIKQESL